MVTWNDQGRFHIIHKYKHHIKLYAIISTIGIIYCIINLNPSVYYYLVVPCIISGMYVIPLIGSKRIRDIHYVKIFLIAIVWSFVSIIPLFSNDINDWKVIVYFIEKVSFLLAITIPFDVRDLEIDKVAGLKTLANFFGTSISYKICYYLLAVSAFLHFVIFNHVIGITMVVVNLFIASILYLSSRNKNDYLFSGLLDGSFILRFLGVFLI